MRENSRFLPHTEETEGGEKREGGRGERETGMGGEVGEKTGEG